MKIFKYLLAVTDVQCIEMPMGSEILTVQMQGDVACLWALVNPENPMHKKTILICGTGHQLDAHPGYYIGTFQVHGGSLVFHVFEQRV